jgi:hypothetical protein
MQYTETQLTKLIEDVEREFTAHLAKAEDAGLAPLAKAEEGDKKPEPKKEEDYKPEGEAKPEGEKPSEEAKPEAEAKPAPAEGAPPAAAAPQHAEGHDYDPEDLEHMHQMYSSMSKGELKAHHDCIAKLMKCGDMMPGVQKSEDGLIEAAPPKNSPGAKDAASDANGAAINKNALGAKSADSDANGEKINKGETERQNGGKIEAAEPHNTPGAKSPASDSNGDKVNKSEGSEIDLVKSELQTANAKYEDLKKNFDAVAAFLTKLVEKKAAPAAKAITHLDVIAKSEGAEGEEKTLTKSEIHDVLCKKSSEPSLKKSDREAINVYYAQGQIDTKGISHLLK